MFIGHTEIVAFLLYRFDADKPAPLLRRWILPLYYHKLLSAPSPSRDTPLSRSLSRCRVFEVTEQIRQRHQFVVVGYVVMPEHVHLLFSAPELTEPERGNPSLVLAALKQTFAHRLLRELRAKAGAQTDALWSTPVAAGDRRRWQ